MFVREDIYKVDLTEGAYCYCILTGEHNVLIDANFDHNAQAIIDDLKAAGIEKIDAIFLTHSDGDHIKGAKIISDHFSCPVFLSAREKVSMTDAATNKRGVADAFEGVALPELITFDDDAKEMFGIEIVPSYGHTYGHLCFLYEDALFAGDLIAERDGVFIELDPKYIRDRDESLKAIDLMNDTVVFSLVCPTHGEPIEATMMVLSGDDPWVS